MIGWTSIITTQKKKKNYRNLKYERKGLESNWATAQKITERMTTYWDKCLIKSRIMQRVAYNNCW